MTLGIAMTIFAFVAFFGTLLYTIRKIDKA